MTPLFAAVAFDLSQVVSANTALTVAAALGGLVGLKLLGYACKGAWWVACRGATAARRAATAGVAATALVIGGGGLAGYAGRPAPAEGAPAPAAWADPGVVRGAGWSLLAAGAAAGLPGLVARTRRAWRSA